MMQATMAQSQSKDDDVDESLPTCACGTDRTKREATPEREYTLLGTLYALWGGTSIPAVVRFRCVHCGEVFDESRDRALLRAHII
jgi:hypothetical protein